MPDPSRAPRRSWLRFSLRTLLILSFLVGSGWLLHDTLPVWRLEYVLEVTDSKSTGRTYTFGTAQLNELHGQHFALYKHDKICFDFEFFETFNEKSRNKVLREFSFGQHATERKLSPDLTRILLADHCHACLFGLGERRKVFEWALLEEGVEIPEIFQAPHLAFSSDGALIAVITQLNRVFILDANTGAIARKFTISGRNFRHALFSPDSKSLLLDFDAKLELLNLADGTLRFSRDTPLDTSYSHCAWLAGEPDTLVARNARAVEWLNAKTGETIKQVWNEPGFTFDGFSSDGRRFHIFRAAKNTRDVHCFVRDSTTGAQLFSCDVDRSFSSRGTPFDSSAKILTKDKLCMIANPVGDTRLWNLDSGLFVDELRPAEMTTLPPLRTPPKFDIITCAMYCVADITISNSFGSLFSDNAVFIEGQRNLGFGQDIERDYRLCRNHPDAWWGLACRYEFWLTVLIAGMFLWSVVRDWRELPRAKRNLV